MVINTYRGAFVQWQKANNVKVDVFKPGSRQSTQLLTYLFADSQKKPIPDNFPVTRIPCRETVQHIGKSISEDGIFAVCCNPALISNLLNSGKFIIALNQIKW